MLLNRQYPVRHYFCDLFVVLSTPLGLGLGGLGFGSLEICSLNSVTMPLLLPAVVTVKQLQEREQELRDTLGILAIRRTVDRHPIPLRCTGPEFLTALPLYCCLL
jgi:hypothetical protein